MSKARKTAQPEKPDDGPWIELGAGRFRSAQTGRLRYDPWQDPAYQADMRRRAQGKAA